MGLPGDLVFRTKGQLAIDICTEALADSAAFDFLCGDEVYGACTELRGFCEERRQGYVDLWVYGIALLGGYGAYFTTSQLFSQYVTTDRNFDPSAGGLLSALILLAGIPGSVLGGHLADRSTNLRMFVVGPLVTVAALLALIPVAPNILLWPLGIGIGFFLIFGFAAWLAVPSRVSNIRAEHIGSATGLMLTLAAIGSIELSRHLGTDSALHRKGRFYLGLRDLMDNRGN
jgi:nitrate/nitrite transporter NarK